MAQSDAKIKHIWTVLCRESVIDKETNNISLINVVEQISVSTPIPFERQPAGQARGGPIPISLEIVSLWIRAEEAEPALGHCRVTVLSPSGPLEEAHRIPVDLRKYQRMRTRQRFGGLPVSEPGQYLFRVEYRDDGETGWYEVGAIPVRIIIDSAPEQKT